MALNLIKKDKSHSVVSIKLDEQEFHNIFKEYYAALCSFAFQYMEDADMSADIVQDVFAKLWQIRDDFFYLHQVKAFLYTAVRNHALNELEHSKVAHEYEQKIIAKKADAFFRDAIVEEDDYDLMVMGRTQGQGCYCFVNGLVQTQVQKLQGHYPYIVVDNEAGMEHISRGILPMMEVAILVSDCSRRGVQAAGRIAKLMKELNFKPQKTGLIVNRVPDGKLDAGTLEEIRNQGLELLGVVPHDDQVYQYDCDGKPIIQLPKDSPVRSALGEIVKKLGL